MQHFISDNNAPAHPSVLAYLNEINQHHQFAYGDDDVTQLSKAHFKRHFGDNIEIFFTQTGSASNLFALGSVLDPHQAIICAHSAHVNQDECGAIERLLGIKLLPLEAPMGKLNPDQIPPLLKENAMVHRVQPKVITITQCTEWGTVYTLDEIKALADCAHQHNMLLHIDGARLANAAVALNCSLKAMTADCGVDLLSFGGTKNGLMTAEAVIFFGNTLTEKAPYQHKQLLQLTSKMRYISGQFIPLLENDLWYLNAKQANDMAALLYEQVKDHITLYMPVESNVIFAKLPQTMIPKLQKKHDFIVWNFQQSIVRWMTAFDSTPETVLSFAEEIKTT